MKTARATPKVKTTVMMPPQQLGQTSWAPLGDGLFWSQETKVERERERRRKREGEGERERIQGVREVGKNKRIIP